MEEIKWYAESFRMKLDAFRTGCDAIELQNLWDKARLGEMEVFYESELVAVLLRLIASDGRITQREADVFNDSFGFCYSLPALEEICDSCTINLAQAFDEDLENGVYYLRGIQERLADAYKELLALGCKILIKSDGIVAREELAEVQRLVERLD